MKSYYSLITLWTVLLAAVPVLGKDLTVYTSRKTHLIEPLFKSYQKKSGVKIKHINGKAGALIQKIKQEGENTAADLLITVDAGNLAFAAQEGLLKSLKGQAFLSNIESRYRGSEDQWVGLSLRARTIFYNKKKVKSSELKNYEDLADKKWKGKLCLRTSRKVYNQSLVAALIKRHGEAKTTQIVEGWVANLAKPVFTSDSLLLKAIEKGDCQVGVANTYYLARLIKKGESQQVGVFWPTAINGGVHINVSGAGVVKKSKNQKMATDFIAWLSQPEAQKIFAELNDEYPVIPGVPTSKILKNWGTFKADPTPLSQIGRSQKQAVRLMDRARYR